VLYRFKADHTQLLTLLSYRIVWSSNVCGLCKGLLMADCGTRHSVSAADYWCRPFISCIQVISHVITPIHHLTCHRVTFSSSLSCRGWLSGSALVSINIGDPRRARLVLGSKTIFGQVNYAAMQPANYRLTQPSTRCGYQPSGGVIIINGDGGWWWQPTGGLTTQVVWL